MALCGPERLLEPESHHPRRLWQGELECPAAAAVASMHATVICQRLDIRCCKHLGWYPGIAHGRLAQQTTVSVVIWWVVCSGHSICSSRRLLSPQPHFHDAKRSRQPCRETGRGSAETDMHEHENNNSPSHSAQSQSACGCCTAAKGLKMVPTKLPTAALHEIQDQLLHLLLNRTLNLLNLGLCCLSTTCQQLLPEL